MARNRKRQANGAPWHRKHDNGWYATIDGERVTLRDEIGKTIKGKDNREQAHLAVAPIKLEIPQTESRDAVLIATVADAYLKHLAATASLEHVENATRTMNDFCSFCGALPAMQLKKKHVRDWVDLHQGWKSDNTKRDHMIIVMAALNHAVKEEELLDVNPIAGLKKPSAFARVTYFKEEEIQEIIDYCNRPPKKKAVSLSPVGDYFRMLLRTGARPFSELAKVTARMIYLCSEAEDMIRTRMQQYPRGSGIALFQTPRGKAWKRCNGVNHFCNLKRSLGWDQDPERRHLSFYTCRHTFAKRILSGYWTGKPASMETLAGLMGNTPKVCWDHYANWCDEYNAPLLQAIGRGL